jgi:tetratricopeptide (TPR) repeat protein
LSKLRVTPIGTCRIHSPLKRAALRYPIEIDLRRNYGYVHTSDEALQQLEFLLGEKEFAPAVAPLILRHGLEDSFEPGPWEPSDLHLVEISSAKSIKSGADFVQSNYLYRHFADFFASSQRARAYWTLVKRGHRGKLHQFLNQQVAFKMLEPAEREVLLNMTMQDQSFKSIKSDMEAIVERLGADRVLFVTHVNALAEDEQRIPSRNRLIRWVTLAAEQLGVGVFDPTAAMVEFGQDRAMEKGGRDLTHYTPAFFDAVYDQLHRSHIGALVSAKVGTSEEEAPAAERAELLATNFETMLEIGDFFATSKQIHAALESAPDSQPLIALRGVIRARIGDFAAAVADFEHSGDDIGSSFPVRASMVEAYSAVGDHRRALQIAEALIGDEFASSQLYRAAAEAAASCGMTETAIRYAKQAFRLDREDLAAALEALKLLSGAGEEQELAEWRKEILENAAGTAIGAFEISMWAVEHHDEELFAAGLKRIATGDKGGTIDLLEDALKARMYRAVADCVPELVGIGRVSRSMAERRSDILTALLDAVVDLTGERRLEDAFHVATAVMPLLDVQSSQVRTRRLGATARSMVREIVRETRLNIRDAYARQDTASMIEAKDAAGAILIDDPDTAVIVARALQTAGRDDEALELVKRIYARHPDHVPTVRWTGRLAAAAGDFRTAIQAYAHLRSNPSAATEPLTQEMDRFFSVAGWRALKQLRDLVEDEDFDSAIKVIEVIRGNRLDTDGRTQRYVNSMSRSLRLRIKDIDEGEGDVDEREILLNQLVRVNPGEPKALRRLALELTRKFRFAEAAEAWERLLSITPDNEYAIRNLERCRRLAIRNQSKTALEGEAAA